MIQCLFFYNILYTNYDLNKLENKFIKEHQKIITSVSNKAKILDSSCKKGVQAVALKKQGFDVTATDISKEMIKNPKTNYLTYHNKT